MIALIVNACEAGFVTSVIAAVATEIESLLGASRDSSKTIRFASGFTPNS